MRRKWRSHLKFCQLKTLESHKFTLFLAADGNFRLQRKNKKGDPDDIALNQGNGYCVDVGPYKAYLLHGGDCDDVSPYCHHCKRPN
jgi:hypothetical protein